MGLRERYLKEEGPASESPLLAKFIFAGSDLPVHHVRRLRRKYQCPVGIQHLPVIIGLRRGTGQYGHLGRRLRFQIL